MTRNKRLAAQQSEEDEFPRPPSWMPGSTNVHVPGPGEEKYSDVFKRFVKPILVNFEEMEMDTIRIRLTFATCAWNLALLSPSSRPQSLSILLKTAPDDVKLDLKDDIARLIERKEKRFADYRWMIISFDVQKLPDGGLYLTVAAQEMQEEER